MVTTISIFFLIVIIFSAIIHEYAHGWMAWKLGDSTAKDMGRLTLNPLAHIDMYGTILVPLLLWISQTGFIVGWAKPVPYNPYNLRNPKRDSALVAIAGPAANIITALVFGLAVRFLPMTDFIALLSIVVYANVLLAVFNLVPIPPLDGSKVLFAVLPDSLNNIKMFLSRYGFFILLIFIFFGFRLIIPPILFIYSLFVGGGGIF
ncbi:site-2 protease family protein [Patescibacteria group bacterium]|nr:site-2 protease family protein [Patescibacteria group bacterium]MBU4512689.1 site-2 protease family protein [Patescibacteria group bacterium]MCG2693591.1 site-2 protease family protein [Candidatus Parcubacteria bacterium]